jgi:hypothetical protein
MRTMIRSLGLMLTAAWLTGCATAPPAGEKASPVPGSATAATPIPTPAPAPHTTTAPASPMPGIPVGTTASGGVIMSGARPTVTDSLPTADAKAVLETIPEPLPADQRVAPKAGAVVAAGAATGAAAVTPDSTATDTSRAEGDIPVPEEMQPLGDKPGAVASGSTSAPPPPPPPPPAAAGAAGAAGASTATSECWRIQLAAVPEADRSERLKSAAESQLGIPCVVQKEKTLYKVRTRDCQSSASADAIRKRAIEDGFSGAFKIRDAKQ